MVTAIGEAGTGLVLLFLPSGLLTLLLGESPLTTQMTLAGRILGAVLIVLGVAWWAARNEHSRPAQTWLIIIAVVYDIVAAALLAYLGLARGMVGILLWPAVAAHTALTFWGLTSLRESQH